MMESKRSAARLRLLACAAFGAIAAAAVPGVAHAQAADAALTAQHDFNLPAQSLSRSITQVASISGLQVLYSDDMANDAQAPAIKGRMSAQDALTRLLAGSGFALRYTSDKVVTLVKVPVGNGTDGEVVTGVVSVEGIGGGSPYFGGAGQAAGVNGVNGSRDITATEGTGSFTSGALTIGSKVPQALKDVPQSISVLTAELMAQKDVTDFNSAMAQLPGATLAQGSTQLENKFYSRGFEITNIEVDGGAPLSTSFTFYPQIDMSQYDHAELLRGADGLLSGYGNPSGTINLVRKKPLDHSQFSLEAQAGSWDTYRLVLDATSPLALDGALRGRVVATYQSNHYFYDTAKDNKNLLYGVLDFDASPTTLITVGGSYTDQHSVPWYVGLPRYQNGESLGLPRSTSFVFPWNRWTFSTTEMFAGIEQKLGGDWVLKAKATRNDQSTTQKVGYASGAVNPTNNVGAVLYTQYTDTHSKQLSLEGTVSGSLQLFGQRQEVTIGANWVDTDGTGLTIYGDPTPTYFNPYQPYPGGPVFCQDYGAGVCPEGSIPGNPPIDVFNFNSADPIYTEPANPLPRYRYTAYGQIQSGAYINLRLTAFDRLHLTTGVRWSQYKYNFAQDLLCTSIPATDDPSSPDCYGLQIGDVYDRTLQKNKTNDFTWPPPVNLSFDVTHSLTVYGGYTHIYLPQANYLDSKLKPIDPITGSNIEAGVKWSARGGRLNISLAAYRIEQKGYPAYDGDFDYNTGEFIASDGTHYPDYGNLGEGRSCCFKADPEQTYRSQGLDFEVAGEIRRGLQFIGSYTFDETKQIGTSFYPQDRGQPFTSIQPKHLYKIWLSYDFAAAGYPKLAGLTLSGGVNGQSSAYRSGSVCVNFTGTPDPVSGYQNCKSYDKPDFITYAFTVPSYAVLSGRIDYRLSANWSLAINLDNILDKTYYQSVGSVSSGNWYGTPRSFTATLRGKW
ncbi:MAG: TonB-dependent receptor [Candidatus Andeanibacterium colombiense]|uniref:TonB-dependent receptor n=1 Tax=Candidatus Andeanibacterium colombiense TaxID=3121345 RepID=A0AAJ5X416_9SPHN|nr:MAG: TonB-dependent receptor [Sphingomonadaceae bacterium]